MSRWTMNVLRSRVILTVAWMTWTGHLHTLAVSTMQISCPIQASWLAKRQDFFNSWGTTDSLQQLMGKEVRLRQSDCGQLRLHVGDEVTFYCILVGDNPLLGIERHHAKKTHGNAEVSWCQLLAPRPILEGKVAELRWGLSAYLQILMKRWGKEGKHEWILRIATGGGSDPACACGLGCMLLLPLADQLVDRHPLWWAAYQWRYLGLWALPSLSLAESYSVSFTVTQVEWVSMTPNT